MKSYLNFICLFLFCPQVIANSAKCPTGQYFVKAHSRKSFIRADGVVVKPTLVSSHCRVNRVSDVYWQDRLQNSRPNDWPYKDEKSKSWTTEERERVLDAICELPDKIWAKSDFRIYRMEKSKDGRNPATSAKGLLVLYDSAFGGKFVLPRVLAHEFAHEIYFNLGESDAKDYKAVTNWFEVGNGFQRRLISRTEGFVADDGRDSPEEDFANNLEFFLFERKSLQMKTPHADRWIQRHFGDSLEWRGCRK